MSDMNFHGYQNEDDKNRCAMYGLSNPMACSNQNCKFGDPWCFCNYACTDAKTNTPLMILAGDCSAPFRESFLKSTKICGQLFPGSVVKPFGSYVDTTSSSMVSMMSAPNGLNDGPYTSPSPIQPTTTNSETHTSTIVWFIPLILFALVIVGSGIWYYIRTKHSRK